MQKPKNTLTIESKFIAMIAVMNLILAATVFFTVYFLTQRILIADMKSRAQAVHSYVLSRLDPLSFQDLNEVADERTALYAETFSIMNAVREIAHIRYLYTAKIASDGALVYIVDGYEGGDGDFRHIGDPIEPEITAQLSRALENGDAVYSRRIQNTDWGAVFVVYYPFYAGGEVVGAVGMEFNADNIYAANSNMVILCIWVASALIVVSVLFTSLFTRRISDPFLRQLAYSDYLTRLQNRNSFEIQLKKLGREDSSADGVSVVIIDLNNLKTINDHHGHELGDVFLKRLSELMIKHLGPLGEAFRIGGDEFAAIVEKKNVSMLPEALENMQRESDSFVSHGIRMEFSFGFSAYSQDSDRSLADALTRADAAMYEMKRAMKQATQEK